MPKIYAQVKEYFTHPQVIHIIGTNGKGTTGRFLATALLRAGFRVGHYTSPHIVAFHERIWLNGAHISDAVLEQAHQKLLHILSQEQAEHLSYFEYTTLLAMYIYRDVDYVVLEAGLGGEHDATAVFDNIFTLVTPIGKDHESFLGNSIEAIVKTKLNAVRKTAILSQQSHPIVRDLSMSIVRQKGCNFFNAEQLLDEKDKEKIAAIAQNLSLEHYLVNNLSLAVSALKFLKIPYTVESFHNARLFGRMSKLGSNVILDVGHNTLAAKAIKNALKDRMFTLVYNSYKDKNYEEILHILKPVIQNVQIIAIEDERIVQEALLEEALSNLAIQYSHFTAFDANKDYLVFGSFSVVAAFLKVYNA